jgi:DNA repair protein RAD16
MDPASNKRKRPVIPDSDDDDDLDADDDNSPDAQLARCLQEQEDAYAASMDAPNGVRRSPRNPRSIQPKSYPVANIKTRDGDDDDDLLAPAAKKPKVLLLSDGGNSVSFSASKPAFKRRSNVSLDSEDSDEFVDIDDSEDEEPFGRPAIPARMRKAIAEQSKLFNSLKTGSLHPQVAAARKVPTSSSSSTAVQLSKQKTRVSSTSSNLSSVATPVISSSDSESDLEFDSDEPSSDDDDEDDDDHAGLISRGGNRPRSVRPRGRVPTQENRYADRARLERIRLESHHPELHTMWQDLENLPKIGSLTIDQPASINRQLKPFQLEGVAWMKAMEQTEWGGGLLGDEMGMGKTIQAVSLIMSDFPAPQPSLVLIPPVALMQWQQEIADYTDGTLKTFVFHGTNAQTKGVTVKELMKYNVILMSYNSLESMYRKQEKGFKRKSGIHKELSVIHQIQFHRVILDEAHNIKVHDQARYPLAKLTLFSNVQLAAPKRALL